MLKGMRVAMLVTEGFEQSELVEPKRALEEARAQALIVSPQTGEVQGWNHYDKADRFTVDVALNEARPEDFDALVLPGGVANPDQLRMQPRAVQFVQEFVESGKPVGVICHGAWTLVEAGVVKGRTLTSWPSIKTDLLNAGAQWVDEEVVVDGNLISSRKPQDLPAFNRTLIEQFSAAREGSQRQPRSTGPIADAPTG